MVEISLKCAIAGQAGTFDVAIDDDTKLFLANKDGAWLPIDDTLDVMLQSGVDTSVYTEMRASWKLNRSNLFGPDVLLGQDVVHVLVVVTQVHVLGKRTRGGEWFIDQIRTKKCRVAVDGDETDRITRASIIKGDALKVLPELDLDDDDSNVDESKVPLTRSNVYADSPREVHVSEGISEEEIVLRRRVGIAFVLGLVLASAICVMLLGVLGHEENYGSTPAIQHHFIAATSATGFKKNLEFYTDIVRHTGSSGDHEMAQFIRSSAIDSGFEENSIKVDEFEMLVNSPEILTLDILDLPNNKSLASFDFIAEYAARQAKRQAKGKNMTMPYPAFHLYSKNGTASGSVVYAHFGSSGDYQALALNNVSVAGKIVLIRMGGDVSLSAKVVLASKFGAVGVLTYT
ncbi:N-acetylated-alpha-linked acidic dipeptidase-like protein [Phytophthora palmivora]|uniref:N-acetylated-alpha-linked acidic dipeptidase-like protein n=1 Tax=Phytophthora palmivora TaxID=4796 RepID=A0A2P4XKY6_9STRA|nr:N-acetylated-alpha-linked acidic dipeptidase-like protein [Phytophthora palmivora]